MGKFRKYKKQMLIASLIALGTVTAYCGLLVIGLMMGALVCAIVFDNDLKLFGDEEEPNDEEES